MNLDLSNIQTIVITFASIAVALTSATISIVQSIKKAKMGKTSEALQDLNKASEKLNNIHNLIDNAIVEAEKTVYNGKEKKDLVLSKVLIYDPSADIEEASKYIDKQVKITKGVNVK